MGGNGVSYELMTYKVMLLSCAFVNCFREVKYCFNVRKSARLVLLINSIFSS